VIPTTEQGQLQMAVKELAQKAKEPK